jgi:hypothetical protein
MSSKGDISILLSGFSSTQLDIININIMILK